jgi:hypothetical protein
MKQIEELLLTPLQLNDVYQKQHREKFVYPYFYKIVKKDQFFYFIGPHHIFDPKDKQIKIIKEKWNEFLEVAKKQNCIVLVEGGERPILKTEKEAVLKHGEPGILTYLADKENVQVISPEPDEAEEIQVLSKKFGKEKTIYYYFARMVAQWNRFTKKPKFEKYLGDHLKTYEKMLNWKGFNFTIPHMIKIHDNIHDHKFDKANYDCFNNDSSPMNTNVCAASGRHRNLYILSVILDLWKKGKNIFIVYGSGHAITLEPALKKLLV